MADSKKSKKQLDFWLSMLKKYEARNLQLELEQSDLQQRLESIAPGSSALHGGMSCTCSNESRRSSSSSCSCSSTTLNLANASKTTGPVCACPSDTYPSGLENLSLFSLNSMDLNCISRLCDMVNREKLMKRQIVELEYREKSYIQTLQQVDDMCACMEGNYKQRLTDVQQNGIQARQEFEKLSEQLMEENARLCDELQDAKLELKQCMERLQGPINRQLEKERRRSQQLENELDQTSRSIENKECCYMQDICKLQQQLNVTTANLADLNAMNDNLKREMCMLKCKYNEIQQDLINQKISEAHTLERLNAALVSCQALQVDQLSSSPVNQQLQATQTPPEKPMEKDKMEVEKQYDDSMYGIARKLSITLHEVDRCPPCRKIIPTDLKQTVIGIKDLADMLGRAHSTGGKRPCQPKNPPPAPKPMRPCKRPKGSISESAVTRPASELNVGETQKEEAPPDVPEQEEKPIEILDEPVEDKNELNDEDVVGEVKNVKEFSCPCSGKQDKQADETLPVEPSGKISEEQNEENKELERCSKVDQSKEEVVREKQTEEIEILTLVEATGNVDIEVEVETDLDLLATIGEGISVTTTITQSGALEVVTEGPASIIETTMTYTKSGNIEVITQITEYPKQCDAGQTGTHRSRSTDKLAIEDGGRSCLGILNEAEKAINDTGRSCLSDEPPNQCPGAPADGIIINETPSKDGEPPTVGKTEVIIKNKKARTPSNIILTLSQTSIPILMKQSEESSEELSEATTLTEDFKTATEEITNLDITMKVSKNRTSITVDTTSPTDQPVPPPKKQLQITMAEANRLSKDIQLALGQITKEMADACATCSSPQFMIERDFINHPSLVEAVPPGFEAKMAPLQICRIKSIDELLAPTTTELPPSVVASFFDASRKVTPKPSTEEETFPSATAFLDIKYKSTPASLLVNTCKAMCETYLKIAEDVCPGLSAAVKAKSADRAFLKAFDEIATIKSATVSFASTETESFNLSASSSGRDSLAPIIIEVEPLLPRPSLPLPPRPTLPLLSPPPTSAVLINNSVTCDVTTISSELNTTAGIASIPIAEYALPDAKLIPSDSLPEATTEGVISCETEVVKEIDRIKKEKAVRKRGSSTPSVKSSKHSTRRSSKSSERSARPLMQIQSEDERRLSLIKASSISQIPYPKKRIENPCELNSCEICAPDGLNEKRENEILKQITDVCIWVPAPICTVCNVEVDSDSDDVPDENNVPDESNVPDETNFSCEIAHPADCDCLDCLCDPCADGIPRKKEHPPDCDCLECLCEEEPCVSCEMEEKPSGHEAGCDCEICQCCKCESKKQVVSQDMKSHASNCSCFDCFLNCGYSQATTSPAFDCDCGDCFANCGSICPHKPGPDDCDCTDCVEVCGDQCFPCLPPVTEKTDKVLSPNCGCSDCTQVCGDKCTGEGAEDEPNGKIEAPSIGLNLFGWSTSKPDKPPVSKKLEVEELQQVLHKIKCSCDEAENNHMKNSSQQRTHVKGTMSDLQTAISGLNYKCKQKDRMIAAMIKELQLRANSKVFDNMLQELSAAENTEADYDRTEICNSLPRPSAACGHPNFPRCGCTLGPMPSSDEYSTCLGEPDVKDYPDCYSAGSDENSCRCSECGHSQHSSRTRFKSNDSNCACSSPSKLASQFSSCPTSDVGGCLCSGSETTPYSMKSEPSDDLCDCVQANAPRRKPASAPLSKRNKSKRKDLELDCLCSPAIESLRPTSSLPQNYVPLPHVAATSQYRGATEPNCPCEDQISKPVDKKRASTSLEITEVRKIAPDSLLVKWMAPASENFTGFEVLVDGALESRVRSARRTSAILHSIVFKDTMKIMVYAVSPCGRCQPPAYAILQQ